MQVISYDSLETKCSYLVDVQIWPITQKLNYLGWLNNFKKGEREFAQYLLNSFLYFNESLVDEFFKSNLHKISSYVNSVQNCSTFTQAIKVWKTFRDESIVTLVTGETPNSSDSGYVFTRKARQLWGISQERILQPQKTIEYLLDTANRVQSIIFVDDFIGSGDQFMKTWKRIYHVKGKEYSFKSIAENRDDIEFYFSPLIACQQGYEKISIEAPEVILVPTHILNENYNLLSSETPFLPSIIKQDMFSFLNDINTRTGIVDDVGLFDYGYHGLGLALAFYHSVPDATLPLFYWDQNGWIPLVRRN